MNIPSEDHQPPLREVYCRVLDETDPEQREKLLDQLCAGRPGVRQRVYRLLDARGQASDGLLARAVEAWQTDETNAALDSSLGQTPSGVPKLSSQFMLLGQSIGPYKLLEILGEGGMGTVYRAQQLEPLVREVAIKVIKPELNTEEAIARFVQERRSMAMMEHPNIARVLEGGEAADGSQYLVMELVRGVPLDEYCRINKLRVEQRLQLFMDLGRAIQHAHAKNIIHRDLKPSNILVAELDGQPLVKVIDFGIAKSFGLPLGADAERTRVGQILGTPLYQPPEQLDAFTGAVDVRCDVYALGVVLYKLLTDTTPIDYDLITKVGYEGVMRRLQEQDYDDPATRVRNIANARQSAGSTSTLLDLPKSEQRELGWIALKALHPDLESRYQSVAEMLDDLDRYRAREPIVAGPPTRMIHMRKWGRKNRVGLFVAGVLLAAMASGLLLRSIDADSSSNTLTGQEEGEAKRAELWRETSQLQIAVSAFRESDYSALRASIADLPPSSIVVEPPTDAAISTGAPQRKLSLTQLLYNAAHPRPAIELTDSADIQSAAFSPMSSRLIVATKAGQLRLYSCKDGGLFEPPTVIGTHPGRIDSLAISPDGSTAVTGTDTLWFWDLDNAKLLRKGAWLDAGIESIEWSPDGQTVAAGGRYESVWVGDIRGNELFRITNNHRHETLLFAPDSKSLYIPTREGVDEYEIASGKKLRSINVSPLENVRTIALAGPNNRYMIVADRFEELASVINVQTGETVGALPLEGRYPVRFRSTGAGRWLAIQYPDGKCSLLRLDEIGTGSLEIGRKLVFQVFPPQPLQDEDRLDLLWIKSAQQFVTIGGRQPCKLWDWDGFDSVQVRRPPMQLWDAMPGRADELVFFPNDPREIGDRAYYVPLGGHSQRPMGDKLNTPTGLFSNCSLDQLVASLSKNEVEIVDLVTGQILARIEYGALPGEQGISLSKDGTTVAVANDQKAWVWKTVDRWKAWERFELVEGSLGVHVQLSDSGDTLCVNDGRFVRELDVRTGQVLRTYDDLASGAHRQLEISDPSGHLIIGRRETLSIMDRETCELLHQVRLDSEIRSTLSTSDGSYLITGHRDSSIRVWHLETKQQLGVLFQPPRWLGPIVRLEAFPDRNRILAIAQQGNEVSPIILGN